MPIGSTLHGGGSGNNSLRSGYWPMVSSGLGTSSSFKTVMDPMPFETSEAFGTDSHFHTVMDPMPFETSEHFGTASLFGIPEFQTKEHFGTASSFKTVMDPMPIQTSEHFGTASTFKTVMNPMRFRTSEHFGTASLFETTITGPVASHNSYPDDYVIPNAAAWLVDPNNQEVTLTGMNYTQQINVGHSWQAHTADLMATNYDPEGQWRMFIRTRKGLFKSPPLALIVEELEQGKEDSTALSGTDFTSWRESTEGLTGPLFQFQPANKIIQFAADVAGAEVLYLGDVFNYMIEEYNFHSGTLVSHIAQLAHDFGWNFKIDNSGRIVLFPVDFGYDAYRLFYPEVYKETIHPGGAALFMRLLKQSRASTNFALIARTPGLQGPTNLPTPLDPTSIHVIPQNIMGTAVYLDFLDEHDVSCAFFRYDPTAPFAVPYVVPTSTNPAVKVVWSVLGPQPPFANFNTFVRVLVGGRAPGPAGQFDHVFELNFPSQIPLYEPIIDGARRLNYGEDPTGIAGIFYPAIPPSTDIAFGAGPLIINGAPPSRFKILTVSSSLWPTINSITAASIGRRLWIQEQKGVHTWSMDLTEPDPFFEPGEMRLADNYGPRSRVEGWTINWQDNNISQRLNGFIPIAVPSGTFVEIGIQV